MRIRVEKDLFRSRALRDETGYESIQGDSLTSAAGENGLKGEIGEKVTKGIKRVRSWGKSKH